PRLADLQDFRDEVMAASTAATKALQSEQQKLAQAMDSSLSERQLAENRWKATFEETISARIQDLWSGLHSTSRKLQESMQYLQTEMVTQEEASHEVTSFVDTMRVSSERLERDNKKHAKQLADQEKDMEHLHGMLTQAAVRLDEQDGKLSNQVETIYQQLESAGVRAQEQFRVLDTCVAATDKGLTTLSSELASCQSSLTVHQDMLRSLDTATTCQREDLGRLDEFMTTSEAKIGGLDGRVAQTTKKLAATIGVLEEHYQERQQLVGALQASVNHAALDRVAMKRVAADMGFSLQETQQTLHEVSKLASTTELALARTAAELPKLHALVSTNSSNIAKNRQSIRDVTSMAEEDRKVANTLQRSFEKEVTDSATRFAAAAQRDDQAQDAITTAVVSAGNVKLELEERIRYNGNLIHQLNTMVDSLAITESTEDMEDKMASFALACAQLGLKLEFFGRKASASDGGCVMKADVKADLAILLTKVIRFLGSGVAIDQNKYLLTAKRAQAVDPVSGQITMELPPQHVLEGFRLAKASLFTAKTRTAMDQLQPVVRTNRTSLDFRDAFERKLRFVLEFGLANLFPNVGKPKNPANRRSGEFGTCIACDRPIDDNEDQQEPQDPESSVPVIMRHSTQKESAANSEEPASETALQHRQQSGGGSRPSSAALGNRIDTKSVIRGRSGTSQSRPKSGSEVVHYAPGKVDFVYRGGFRIPKPSGNPTANGAINNSASSSSILLAGVGTSSSAALDKKEDDGDGLLDLDNSYLEKVALLGKCQVIEVPSIGEEPAGVGGGAAAVRAVRAVRPHTAPLRTKSLPKLEVAVGSANATTLASPTADNVAC
ncbi:hypothetical protein BBJ28_00026004, partial [Nothophytophthora sp. Chile5]